jgi:hypothetical protein
VTETVAVSIDAPLVADVPSRSRRWTAGKEGTDRGRYHRRR